MKKDLINKKFGKLTVLKQVPYHLKRYSNYLCLCECGNKKEVLKHNLLKGKTKSCGCYKDEACYNKFVNKTLEFLEKDALEDELSNPYDFTK